MQIQIAIKVKQAKKINPQKLAMLIPVQLLIPQCKKQPMMLCLLKITLPRQLKFIKGGFLVLIVKENFHQLFQLLNLIKLNSQFSCKIESNWGKLHWHLEERIVKDIKKVVSYLKVRLKVENLNNL